MKSADCRRGSDCRPALLSRTALIFLITLGFLLFDRSIGSEPRTAAAPSNEESATGRVERVPLRADPAQHGFPAHRPAPQSIAQDLNYRLYLPFAGRVFHAKSVWRHYRTPRIEALTYDERNELLWAATPNGLLNWDLRQGLENEVSFSSGDGPLSDELKTVAMDAEGQLWIGGVGGAARRDAGGAWTRWSAEDGLPVEAGISESEVRSLALGPDGRMLAGTRAGLVELGPDGRWAAVPGFPLPTAWVEDIAYHPASEQIAVATSVGAAIRGPDGRWERAGDRWVHATVFDRDGNLWFGGNGVSVRWRSDGTWAWYDRAYSIQDLALSTDGSLLCASDEGLWSRSPEGTWTQAVLPNGWVDGLISLATAADGRLWAGRPDGRLDQRDGAGRWSSRRGGGIPLEPESLALGSEGEVWIGGIGGAARLGADGDWRWYGWPEGLHVGNVASIVVDREGRAWIGSGGNDGMEPFAALYSVDRSGRVVDRTPPDLDDRTPAPALLAPDGSVWHAIGHAGLLVHRPDGSRQRVPLPAPYQSAEINSAAVDDTGTLWWSLYGGDTVLGLDPSGTWEILQEGTGLLAGKVNDIDADPWGAIWMVGAHGIQRGLSGSRSEFWPAANLGFPLSRVGSLLGAVIGAGPDGEVAVAHNEGLGLMDGQEQWQHWGRDEVPFVANVRDVRIAEDGGIWIVSTTHGLSLLLR